jgi:hypothetical protein
MRTHIAPSKNGGRRPLVTAPGASICRLAENAATYPEPATATGSIPVSSPPPVLANPSVRRGGGAVARTVGHVAGRHPSLPGFIWSAGSSRHSGTEPVPGNPLVGRRPQRRHRGKG